MKYTLYVYTKKCPSVITRLGFKTAAAALRNVIIQQSRGMIVDIFHGKHQLTENTLNDIVNPPRNTNLV